jgi:hypothetical protein
LPEDAGLEIPPEDAGFSPEDAGLAGVDASELEEPVSKGFWVPEDNPSMASTEDEEFKFVSKFAIKVITERIESIKPGLTALSESMFTLGPKAALTASTTCCSTGSCCGCVTLESSSLPHAHKAKNAEANGNIYLFLITNPF